ncbi:hypothetical protein RND81_05G166600 [Saponaria officinalis]|uniref:Uncharacterized protein n=1 Tax=Saponaria officinalis TaxID=3572 RepID=A0AAW1L1P7_SAPOF
MMEKACVLSIIIYEEYILKLQGEKSGRRGQLAIATEIFKVAPCLFMVDVRKSKGDTLEFYTFYQNLSSGLEDIIWKSGEQIKEEEVGTSYCLSVVSCRDVRFMNMRSGGKMKCRNNIDCGHGFLGLV